MAETTIPGTGTMAEIGWRETFRRSGVTDDYTGVGVRVTATGASQAVTIGVGTALVEGFLYENTTPKAIDLGAVVSPALPTSGQERYSRVVLRLNTASSPYVVTAVAITGSPATSGVGAVPGLVRNSSTHDFPLAIVRQTPTALSQASITDEREWWGEHHELAAGRDLEGPLGSTRGRGAVFHRHALVAGLPAWISMDVNEGNTTWSNAPTTAVWSGAVSFRRFRGALFLNLAVVRQGSTLGAGGSGTIGTLPAGFRPDRVTRFFGQTSAGTEPRFPVPIEVTTGGAVAVAGSNSNITVGNSLVGSASFPLD